MSFYNLKLELLVLLLLRRYCCCCCCCCYCSWQKNQFFFSFTCWIQHLITTIMMMKNVLSLNENSSFHVLYNICGANAASYCSYCCMFLWLFICVCNDLCLWKINRINNTKKKQKKKEKTKKRKRNRKN